MKKHGCLVWWTLHTNQPLGIWKLSPSVMLSHCCPLFRPMLPMEQQYIPTSGRHIDKWQVCQVFPLINHSVTFVDPVSGTHTQNIESYWGKTKRKLKNMKGCHASQLPSYLDEFMWHERYGQLKLMPLRTSCCIFQNNTHFNFFTRFLNTIQTVYFHIIFKNV